MKAGKLKTGETMAEKLLQKGEACLLIVASDASENTRTKFDRKCFFYKKPLLIYSTKEVLSHSVGQENRSVFIIAEQGFAARIYALISQEENPASDGSD